MVSAVHAIVAVVGTHDAGRPRVQAVLEMWQVDFLLGTLVAGHAAFEARVFHVVERVMLHAGHDVLVLDATHQGRAHLPDLVRLLAVSLLAASPARVVRHVDADPGK